jgi:hypothetical protein
VTQGDEIRETRAVTTSLKTVETLDAPKRPVLLELVAPDLLDEEERLSMQSLRTTPPDHRMKGKQSCA